jgi:hypothetical protein
MSSISSFKPGDVVLHASFGRGEVIGARLNSLVLRYKCGIRIAQPRTPSSLLSSHTLTCRDSTMTIQVPAIGGGCLLVDRLPHERIDPGSIVLSSKYGLGQFLGRVYDRLIVAFIRDGGAARFVKSGRAMFVVRSKESLHSSWTGIGRTPVTADTSEAAAAPLGFIPGDFVRVRRQCAACLGTTSVGDRRSLLFETDEMLLSNLGVGVFAVGRMDEGELVARIGAAGKRRVRTESGGLVELSINTSDFVTFPLLPLDRITVDDRNAIVVGAADGRLFVQFEGCDYVVPLRDRFSLVFRRLSVPTARSVAPPPGAPECVRVLLHADAYRGMAFQPGDVVEQDGEQWRVVGRLARRTFLVRAVASGVEVARTLAPCGMAAAKLIHRARFFD